jgi:DNA-binding response OmpR family regulator
MGNKGLDRNILLIEDDLTLAYFIRKKLEKSNYGVNVVDNGKIGSQQAVSIEYDLILLDIGLPDMNGLKILKKMRDRGLKTPVIMITENSDDNKQVESFQQGANLFHSKPIDFELLEAQINSLLELQRSSEKIEVGDLYIEPQKQYLKKAGEEIYLSYKEFRLILNLVEAKGDILTRQDILNLTFKGAKESEEGSVDTLVSRVRKKLGDYKGKSVIETVHSRGFRLNLAYFKD